MNMFIRVLISSALLGGLSACAPDSQRPAEQPPVVVEDRDVAAPPRSETGARDAAETDAANSRAAEDAAKFTGHPLDDPESLLVERVLYFDLDEYRVDAQYRGLLDAHARYLADDPAASVVVAGHADERGSREYNIALGERRALAVRQFLLFQGARSDQVRVVSFGEERPADPGHTESAWRLNRRVELQYSGH